MNKPEITILCGLPGSGKSTYVGGMPNDTVVISTDNFIEAVAAEQGKTYSDVFTETISDATDAAWAAFREALKQGRNIVWDQTNLTRKKRKNILRNVPDRYKKAAVFFHVSNSERQRRLKNRPGKVIPPHVDKSMRETLEVPKISEGFDEITLRINGVETRIGAAE